MPTGYTAAVVDGSITDLRSFALQCARGMGALITMRDDPWDAPIPEKFEPSDYYAKKLAEAQAERARIYAMSDSEAEEAARVQYERDLADGDEWLNDKRNTRARYQAMIALVEPWQQAPEGLKEFMLEQLRGGMDFDCRGGDVYWKSAVHLAGEDWRRQELEKLHKDIEYHAGEDAKERARTEGRNAWLAQLRKSLADAEAA